MNEINKESVNNQTSHDKEVSDSDLLCEKKKDVKFPENINDDLIIGTYVKHNNESFSIYVRLNKEDQNWKKVFEVLGFHAFLPANLRGIMKHNEIIQGDPFDYI